MNRALLLTLLAVAGSALAPAAGFAGSCVPSVTRVCLQDSRFGVEVAWTIPGVTGVTTGAGHASPMTNDTGIFWFFGDSNLELVVKVLDGRAVNGHFWVYYGGLSDVEYTITVTDSQTRESEIYHNPASQLASGADTSAFAEEPLAASGQIRFGMLGDVPATAAETSPTVAVPLRQGPELQVNIATLGGQYDPDVAIGSDGGSLVVWTGEPAAPEISGVEVYGRFYDAAGNPRGGEILLDPHAGVQSQARVAAAPGGGYMAVWQDNGFIAGRAYSLDGQPLGAEIRIGTSSGPQTSPDIAAVDGGFVVVWADGSRNSSTGDPGTTILGQRFNAQGGRAGGLFLIGGMSEDLREPHLAASPAGGFVATWIEHFGLMQDVVAQRVDAMSQPLGGTLQANVVDSSRLPGQHQGAIPVFHADGSFSILWTTSLPSGQTGPKGLLARHYSAAGTALGGVIELRRGPLSPQTPAATLLPSGDILVLWYEAGRPADPDGGVLGGLFDSSWTPRGSELRTNAFTLLPQREPAVASDAAGRLMAVWTSGNDMILGPVADLSQDGSAFGVFGQRFTTATCALTSDQLCLNGRFRVDVRFTSPFSGDPESAHAVPLTSDTGAFWFFGQDNLELMIKVLDGRPVNGHFWVYAGALSDVAYTITVTDTVTGQVKTYRNDPGHLASRADVEAF